MKDLSYIFNAHPDFIESMYQNYQSDAQSVDQSWRTFFEGFDFASDQEVSFDSNGPSENGSSNVNIGKELKVLALIKGFRNRGHLLSKTNPIKERVDRTPNLKPEDFGLTEADLDTVFLAGKELPIKDATLKQILDYLNVVYCGNIGFEYHHISDREKRRWLRTRIEIHNAETFSYDNETQKRILEKLNGAVIFEKFLHTKYVGQKRFSLEGGENMIVALDAIIKEAGEGEIEEINIGMAHRGRLNVLANIMGKTYEQIFDEFEGNVIEDKQGDGDVKYHLGYSSQMKIGKKTLNVKLAPNPSHLEAVGPVVEGFSRAKVDILYKDYSKVLPIQIHGDAAVVGQGVVYETAQMSELEAYHTGGTIHFVINNQIGFTTNFYEGRSSIYCTAAATAIDAPVFHVNGDDAEAVMFVTKLAYEYRQKFNSNIFIDMVCYRKYGHNEGDDPNFTQLEMYDLIKTHKNPRELFVEKLSKKDATSVKLAEEMEKSFWDSLQQRLDRVKQDKLKYEYQEPELVWRSLKRVSDDAAFVDSPKTGITKKNFEKIVDHLMTIPENFKPISKVKRLLKGKQKLIDNDLLDWSMGEMLAYGSVVLDKNDVRFTGQDVRRGTFSHRHAYFYDAETFQPLNRLENIEKGQGDFRIFNSLLSEYAVLGFEYGYAMASPNSLVIWEAQFGDFANGANIIFDQFISAGESKWGRMNGVVMLLPHGYAGQGPEHSSARMEKYLQSCAENNMSVVNVTTPANFFHVMRRQLARPFRKPLIVFTPKSLLRHPKCVSPMKDFQGNTKFQEVIGDDNVLAAKKVTKVLYCTGKIYYELLAEKEANNRKDVAIVRLEQLYPFPYEKVQVIAKKYAHAEQVWVQEESENMGAYVHVFMRMKNPDLGCVSRKKSASPATGFKKVHDSQQADLIKRAFA